MPLPQFLGIIGIKANLVVSMRTSPHTLETIVLTIEKELVLLVLVVTRTSKNPYY